ncbi:hypothetical protein KC19_4G151400 [Ceratodon purpureus]|uniref:Uncharacterized protein n=1 Tax=Ceratodon purpureus TaxID=3225 RepID=A0A8T0I8U5_CERPU|nr:hypothetical protein KC19_4G148300 [Ceratodon purpureus]KAG0580150.1 hypothetical protein KC19_4G151400 [Ceratodon purpureus]
MPPAFTTHTSQTTAIPMLFQCESTDQSSNARYGRLRLQLFIQFTPALNCTARCNYVVLPTPLRQGIIGNAHQLICSNMCNAKTAPIHLPRTPYHVVMHFTTPK